MSSTGPLDPDNQSKVSVTPPDDLMAVLEQIDDTQPKVSIEQQVAEPSLKPSTAPTISVENSNPTLRIAGGENTPKVSLNTVPKTTITTNPEAPETTLKAKKEPEYEEKSKMAEVNQPVGETAVFKRMFEMLLGAGQAALAVAAVGVAGACAMAGGALRLAGGAVERMVPIPLIGPGVGGVLKVLGNMMQRAAPLSMRFAAFVAKEHPAVQEYRDRFVKVPKPTPKGTNNSKDKPKEKPKVNAETEKPTPQSGELAEGLQIAKEQMADLQRQNPVDKTMTPQLDAEKSKAENISDIKKELEAKAEAQAAASKPEVNGPKKPGMKP